MPVVSSPAVSSRAPRFWRRARLASVGAVVVVSAVAAACGPAPTEVALQLLRDADATFDSPAALKIVVRNTAADDPEVFGPFDLERDGRTRLSADLPQGARYTVDVSACASLADCDDDIRLARGCSGVETVDSTDAQSLTITLYDEGTPEARACPPELP